mmetsp:Transcript_31203/g.47785  ORF Transcript_31203/g.47785 Transcript_31203/m.47785 type:complete len:109 (-) Transcript_31203:106-432(-)
MIGSNKGKMNFQNLHPKKSMVSYKNSNSSGKRSFSISKSKRKLRQETETLGDGDTFSKRGKMYAHYFKSRPNQPSDSKDESAAQFTNYGETLSNLAPLQIQGKNKYAN